MGGPVDLYGQVADTWAHLSTQIGEEQWDAPTPCADWDVRQLVDHVLAWQAQGLGLMGAVVPADAGWEGIRATFEATLSDPRRLEGSVPAFGGIPKHDMAGFLIGDLLIHSWDLARAIGADDTLPAGPVEATTMGLHHAPEALLRGRNPLGVPMMGAAVEVADDASAQDRMIAFTGRRP
jgi:uncharacterized protein (TIGR03086 family)